MDKVIKIKLSEHGESLGTRDLAEKLRNEAVSLLKTGNMVLFDFNNIEIISSGFADELFGKLLLEIGGESFRRNVRINGFSSENSMNVIMLIIKRTLNFRMERESSTHSAK